MSKRSTKVDATDAVNEYINKEDWRINANANTNYSHASLINNLAGKLIANFWLDTVYSKEEGDAHRNGDYHIHDLDCLSPYCFTIDTQVLMADGTRHTFEDLVKNYADSTFEVCSVDDHGRPVIGVAYAPRLTRVNAEVVEVVFEDDSKVRCTPDHLFMIVNGDLFEWVKAEELQEGTRVKCHINGVVQIVRGVYQQLIKEDVYDLTVDTYHNFTLGNGVIVHNCCGHDFQKILDEGFNGVIGRVGSKPPKHFREALYQLANYFGILQAEWAGAQAVSSFDTYLAPHVFFDTQVCGLTYDDVKKAMRNFVFNLNVPSRWGQSPFTNVTIDWTIPNLMKDLTPTRGGKNFFCSILDEWDEEKDKQEKRQAIVNAIRKRFKEIDPESYEMLKDDDSALMFSFTYRFFQKEMNIINRAFYEVLNEGDMLGQPFTFPIPTINITEDFDWDGENTDLLFENTAKYGSSYFQNFIGSQYMIDENGNKVRDPNAYTPNDVRSMCPLALNTPVVTNHGIKRLDRLNEATDKVMLHGVWYSFRKITNIPKQRVLVVTLDGQLSDGKPIQFVAGEDHLQPIYDQSTGTYLKRACKYLNTSDYIPVEEVYHADDGQHVRPEGNRFIIGADHLQYIQIKEIYEIPSEQLMCIEVNNEEHNFTLGNGIITSNCRLQLDKKVLRLRGGGLFGSDSRTGSIGVCTINCPRLGYKYRGNKEKMYKELDHLIELAKSTLEKKRKFVTELLDRGLYPYTRRYIGSFNTYFSTIGVNGVNEMIRNFTNDEHNITDDYGQAFAKELLDHIRAILVRYQEETGNLYNLEATPAEGTMRRFAHSDKKKYPDIIQAGFSDSLPYYTNSTQLPVEFTADAFTALDLQDDLQKKYSGGCCQAGNFVLTDKGEMLIEDIVKNFNPDDNLKVMSWNNETKEAEWDKVVDAMSIDVSQHDKIKVSLSAGEFGTFDIVTSDWHPFLVKKGKDVIEVRADELEDGMEVLGWHETYIVEDTSKVDVEDNQFYDLTTEKNHNYLCGNHGQAVFIHNTVFHVYTRERVSSAESCKRLVRTILSNYRLPYISITPTFSVCPIHGRIEGEHEFCPKCDEELIRRHAQEVDTNL